MSVLAGGTNALVQLLARRRVESQQDMLRALQVADKQKQWQGEQERIRQTDEQLRQTADNQKLLRQEADRRQDEIERLHEQQLATNLAENALPEENMDPKAAALLDKYYQSSGIVKRTPGLELGAGSGVAGPTGQAPVLKIMPDKVSSLGGSRWQAARAADAAKVEAQQAANQARIDAREDNQTFLAGQGELNRNARTDLANIAASARNSGRNDAGLTVGQEISATTRLQNRWDGNTKGVREMDRMYTGMHAAFSNFDKDPNGASTIVINALNKIIDPNSVVREAEYDRLGEALSLKSRIEGWVQKYRIGGAPIPKADLALMMETARMFRDGVHRETVPLRQATTLQAKKYGIDPEFIFGPAPGQPGAAAGASGAGGAGLTPEQVKQQADSYFKK